MATIIAVTNQKGGVAKTTTTLCLGSGLAEQGYRVLLIDLDPQGSLSICLGCEEPEKESYTMADIMSEASMNPLSNEMVTQGIFSTEKRIDYIPANWKMASVEMQLVKNSGGETVLRQVLNMVEQQYDFVLLDCPPTLGMTTLNALVAADKVLSATRVSCSEGLRTASEDNCGYSQKLKSTASDSWYLGNNDESQNKKC